MFFSLFCLVPKVESSPVELLSVMVASLGLLLPLMISHHVLLKVVYARLAPSFPPTFYLLMFPSGCKPTIHGSYIGASLFDSDITTFSCSDGRCAITFHNHNIYLKGFRILSFPIFVVLWNISTKNLQEVVLRYSFPL